jgi:phospholipid/cholesterol/gamma-HCH transport system permease protein
MVIDDLGKRLIGVLIYSLNILRMIYLSCRATIYDQAQGWRTVLSVVSAQIYFTGWQALPIITILAVASGGLVIMQSTAQLSLVGGSSMLGHLIVAITMRELAPLLTALIVIARSGTAVASEIGTMRVNREIEALEAMGINPLSFIVFPRLLGGIISVVCLGFYFNVVSMLGGYVVARFIQDMPFHYYLNTLANAITFGDFALFLLKNTFSGAIIFIVSCYQGMLVKQSPHEVPQVTTKAVMNSIIYVVGFNLTVSTIFYLNTLMRLGII